MSKLRLGYVGCGFMAQKVHIPNITALADRCELVALAEVRPKLAAKVAARYAIPRVHPDHRALAADPGVDAVVVSGHYAVQGEIAIDLLRAGKDVLVEKPMAITVEQGERILAAEKAGGKRLMVAYMKRYDAGNLKVKELADAARADGSLGKPRFVRNHGFGGDWIGGLDTPMDGTDEPYPPVEVRWPAWLPERFRNGYIDYLQQYTHNVNLLRWLLQPSAPISVQAARLDPGDGWRGVVLLEADGVPITIESGWVDFEGWEEHTQIFYDKGWIRTEAPPLLLKNVPATVELYRAGADGEKSRTAFFPANGRLWSYREEVRHFVDRVRDGQPFASSAADSLNDVRLLEDIYKAHVAARAGTAAAAKA